ncbi:unnamed protein product [Rotaria magnacalcarata]|uniref:Pheromone-processing carboxypeptidase KEX1 n=1 Tax=Rotaria magnacalcarata TaxID=392030 RepID=A0A820FX61_9BILA|nr:unnamed protein product [Rotaria magnacalcarata]CAF4266983.1 unnamed protein product [Rotaria magnacalcarata]
MIANVFIFVVIVSQVGSDLQASDFYVTGLPFLPKEASSIRMHAGHLPVNSEHHGALFFWHFASKYAGDKPRTVIWLNGGPGCSSLIGAWAEISPFRFQDKTTIVENNGSWHMFTNLLFIDQPAGTGFSYIDTDSFIHELDEMTNHFLNFLDRYINIFPELLQNDIYLAGESFAGQYIPYIARAILTKRSELKLLGLLIGNGWIDPSSTYESYLPFAVANNLVENNSVLYHKIAAQTEICLRRLSNETHVFDGACELILSEIAKNGAMNNHYPNKTTDRCVNIYDVRLDDTWPACGMNWPVDIEYATLYLHREDVMSRIYVDGKKSGWTECADSVFYTFRAYHSIPSIKLLPDLLRQIPIVLYSGERDFICNHWGTERMMDAMTWNNRTGFDLGNKTSAPLESWIVDDEPAGLIRTARNLTYILFYNASHMVPYDYARRSSATLHQFIKLNLLSDSDKTTEKNKVEKMNTKKRRAGLIALALIIATIILIGLTSFFVCKRQQIRMHLPVNTTRVLWSSRCHDVDLQPLVVCSLLVESKETIYEPDCSTLV